MTLIKWNRPASPVFREFFDDFFGGQPFYGNMAIKAPAVNIREDQDRYFVEMAVPGFKKNEFKLAVEENVLSISAERNEEKESKDQGYTRREFNYSSFSRSFTLPDTVDVDHIQASYEDGILAVQLPKKEEAKTRNRVIEIA